MRRRNLQGAKCGDFRHTPKSVVGGGWWWVVGVRFLFLFLFLSGLDWLGRAGTGAASSGLVWSGLVSRLCRCGREGHSLVRWCRRA